MRALSKGSNGKTVNAELARFERAFKAEPANLDLDGWRAYLEGVMQDHVGDDVVITNHAERLLIDIDNYLEGFAY